MDCMVGEISIYDNKTEMIEELKKKASTCCSLDWNQAIGRNLSEKLQTVFAVVRRMQYVTRKLSGQMPDVMVIQPLMLGVFEACGLLKVPFEISGKYKLKAINNRFGFDYKGTVWDFEVYVDESAYMEHHILLTNCVEIFDSEKQSRMDFSVATKNWCKISLLNFVMGNPFGYYNMCE